MIDQRSPVLWALHRVLPAVLHYVLWRKKTALQSDFREKKSCLYAAITENQEQQQHCRTRSQCAMPDRTKIKPGEQFSGNSAVITSYVFKGTIMDQIKWRFFSRAKQSDIPQVVILAHIHPATYHPDYRSLECGQVFVVVIVWLVCTCM